MPRDDGELELKKLTPHRWDNHGYKPVQETSEAEMKHERYRPVRMKFIPIGPK